MQYKAFRNLKNPEKMILWRLKDEKIKRIMKDAMKNPKEEPEIWKDWSYYIMNVVKSVCGILKGVRNRKATWRWNEEVKEVIKKRRLYKVWRKKKHQQ